MSEPATLEDVFVPLRTSNPFLDNRVNGPADATRPASDVADIHQSAFESLTALSGEALAAQRGIGAVLWGEAGIGKSHLLARLAAWADANQVVFVYLHNLQSAPDLLGRSVLHAVVSLLTLGQRNAFHTTPLFNLVRAGLLESVEQAPTGHSWPQLERAFNALVDRWARQGGAGGERSIYQVLFAFFRSTYRAGQGKEDGHIANLAVRWLSGRGLDSAEARLLGLPLALRHDEAVALEDNQQVKQVLVALTRLAAVGGKPFLLAFDQVDNLEDAQFAALARFLEALIDSSPNLLVITAGIQDSLLRWREQRIVQESAWHRLAQFEVLLQRLRPEQAEQIVRARLSSFLAPLSVLDDLRGVDALFPLGRAWHERFLRDKIDLRPRDVINKAREGWGQEQALLAQEGGPAWLAGWLARQENGQPPVAPPTGPEDELAAIDRTVDEALADVRARLAAPGALSTDGDQLVGVLYKLLGQCEKGNLYGVVGVERMPPPRPAAHPSYHLTVRRQIGAGPTLRTGLLVLTVDNATSAAGFLRRARDDVRPLDRLLLVTDERVQVRLGQTGSEYLADLEGRGPDRFREIVLSVAERTELEALQEVVDGVAEVEIEFRPGEARALTRAEVIASHHRRGRYRSSALLREVLEGGAEPGVKE